MKVDNSWQRYYGGKYPDLVERYDLMVSLVRPPSVLDIGCAQGLLGFLLCTGRSEVTEVIGVDLSERLLADGHRRLGACRSIVELKWADAHYLPFEDERFTTVVLCEVLEHLEYPAMAARAALRVLAPGGRVITSVPANETRPQGIHRNVFLSIKQLQDLYGVRVSWKGAIRLYEWHFTWGDKK